MSTGITLAALVSLLLPTSTYLPSMVTVRAASTREIASLVRGTVRNADDGNPLPGAIVVLKGSSRSAEAGTDGSFVIDVSTQSAPELYVAPEPWIERTDTQRVSAGATVKFLVPAKPAQRGGITLAFPDVTYAKDVNGGSSVRGRVIDAEGNGIPDVTVVFSHSSIGTRADSRGYFKTKPIPRGIYRAYLLRGSAPLVPIHYQFGVPSRHVTQMTLRVPLSPPVRVGSAGSWSTMVRGTVRNRVNREPVSGISVVPKGGRGMRTGVDGTFAIDVKEYLPKPILNVAGTPWFTLAPPQQTVGGTIEFVLEPTDVGKAGYTLAFPSAAYTRSADKVTTIRGRVVDAQTNLGIGGAAVHFLRSSIRTKTAADGAFVVRSVRPGPHRFYVLRRPGGQPFSREYYQVSVPGHYTAEVTLIVSP